MCDLVKCNVCFIVLMPYREDQTLCCSHQWSVPFRLNKQDLFKPEHIQMRFSDLISLI